MFFFFVHFSLVILFFLEQSGWRQRGHDMQWRLQVGIDPGCCGKDSLYNLPGELPVFSFRSNIVVGGQHKQNWPQLQLKLGILDKGRDTGRVTHAYRMIHTLASLCSPTVHFSQAHTTEEIRERISCQQAEFASPLYILHITTEGTMCLQWQVAIVHNVLMLTKCQFDPWDRWVGRGCGSWILKQATVWCSYGDGRRHDTDETGNYLPNGRQIQGRERGGKRDEEGGRQ